MAGKEADAAADSGGGKKKLILIIAAVAVLLIGGGLAAFFLLSGDVDEASAESVADAPEPEPEGEPTYHELDPVFVVHLPPGGKVKMLQVGLQVFSRDPQVGEMLERHGPMLRHHLLDVLSNQQAEALYTRAGRETLQGALQDELRDRLAAVGEEKARIDGLYFTQFVMQ